MRPGKWIHPIRFENIHLLFNRKNQKLVSLNPTARMVWEGLQSKLDVSDITALLAKASNTRISQVAPDVDKIISQWRALGFFEEIKDKSKDFEPENKRGNRVWVQDFVPGDVPVPNGRNQAEFQLAGTRFNLFTPHEKIFETLIRYTEYFRVKGPASTQILHQ